MSWVSGPTKGPGPGIGEGLGTLDQDRHSGNGSDRQHQEVTSFYKGEKPTKRALRFSEQEPKEGTVARLRQNRG